MSDVEHVHDQRFDGDDPYLICHGCGTRWDALTGRELRAAARFRPAPGEGLRAAAVAYVAWQYRQPGARRFTLTDLRAALAIDPADSREPREPYDADRPR